MDDSLPPAANAGNAAVPLSMLDAALAYAEQGIKVFPCGGEDGKKPLTKHGFLDATTDERQIRAWWTDHPNASIGSPRDEHRWVADIDGDEGERSLAEIVGDTPIFTAQVRTGRGRHLYFCGPGPRTGTKLRPGIDVRSVGGYVILPPSRHVATGRRYEWVVPLSEICEAPAALIEALGGIRSEKSSNCGVLEPDEVVIPLDEPALKSLRLALSAIEGLADSYGSWIEIGMSLQSTRAGRQAFDLWHDWSKLSAKYRDEADCLKHWRSFGRRDVEVTIATIYHRAAEKGWVHPADLPLPPAVQSASKHEESGLILRRFEATNPHRFATVPPPSRDWIVKAPNGHGVIPRGKVGGLAGTGGSGKTRIAYQLGVAVATRRPWLDYFPVEPSVSRRTLFLVGEDDETDAHRTIYGICDAWGLSDEERAAVEGNLCVVPLAGVTAALGESDAKSLEVRATVHFRDVRLLLEREGESHASAGNPGEGFSLVVIDTLARFGPALLERENIVGQRFIQLAEQLCSAPGNPSIIFTAHTSKFAREDGKPDIRGSSAIRDSMRWVLGLSAESDHVELSLVKSNVGRQFDSVRLRWIEGKFLTAEDPALASQRSDLARSEKQQKSVEKRVASARAADVAQDTIEEERRARILPLLEEALRAEPGLRKGALQSKGGSSDAKVKKVIDWAVANGRIVALDGPNRSTLHYLPGCVELAERSSDSAMSTNGAASQTSSKEVTSASEEQHPDGDVPSEERLQRDLA
ncbi:MAG: bifunctional DNA primase/polymerase [Planctomycetes bacterium]|nr:bifunctional DNA primase/polymerase [Planctomycetota bacterium]